MPAAEYGVDHSSAVTEVADAVFALTSLVDLGRPRTWVAPGAVGYDPSTCYLIRDADEACLIDTGFAAHSAALNSQLRGLIGPGTPLHLACSRVEPDCLGGLVGVLDEFNVVSIASQTNVRPPDYIGPLSGRYPNITYNNGMRPGSTISLGGGRTIDIVEPVIRILPTLWFYDRTATALFTSDFFGGVHLDEPRVGTPTRELDVDGVVAHLLAKFDWLSGADTSRGVRLLDGITDTMAIGHLCPGHGMWASGGAECADRLARTRAALVAMPRLGAAPASSAGDN